MHELSGIWAIVPLKNLENGKSRLAPLLNAQQRARLIPAMMADVLGALAEYGHLPALVVTGDERVARLAWELGMRALIEQECRGESAAVEQATAHAVAAGAGGTLVIPADIPLITAQDIARLVELAPAQGTLLTPGWDGRGTNAVIRRPAELFPLRFGNDSFAPHRAAAEKTGLPVRVVENANIGLDLDSPAELRQFLARGGGTRTHEALAGMIAGSRALI